MFAERAFRLQLNRFCRAVEPQYHIRLEGFLTLRVKYFPSTFHDFFRRAARATKYHVFSAVLEFSADFIFC